ncbi:MAG: PAS domain S-box protein [Flavobacteriales bacterium]|nr:PAS domain S-box protein [Flavobacteriales bacterium]
MTIKTTYSDLEQYKKRVEHRLNELIPVFARATIGDFSKDVPFTENEDEFSELYVGVQVMLDVIRDKLGKLGKWNDELADRIAEKTRAFEEAQYLTHIGSWECDVEKGKLDLSDEMYRIYGLQKQTKPIDYGTFLQYVHPDDRERVGDCVNLSLKSLKPFNIFYRIVRDDGSVRILQGRGKVEADWDGNPVRVLGTGQDVTDLKRVEDELIYARNNLEKKVKERTTKLKRALEDLRKEMARREEVQAKAERLAAIVEGTYDAILSKTLDGTITSWNKAAQRLYGYSPKEAIGKNVAIIVPDERKDELENILLRLSQGKMIKRLETIRRHKNGHLVYVSLTISPIYNSAGEVIGASSIAKDITREVAAQHQMKKSQIRLNNFMNAARDVFAIYDHELRLVDINKAGVKLLGERSKKNLIGKHMNEIFPSIKGTEHQALYEKVLLKGRSKRLETFLSHDVFGNRFFAIEIFKLDEGIGVISRDITQQKQSDQALNESERKYRTLVETMNEGVLIVNNDDVIEFVNETFCRQSGYPMDELVGQKAMDLLLDEDERERMKHMILKRQDGEASQYEIRIKTKWGQKLWMLVNGSPVYSNANEVIGSVGLHTNINQRKQHEAELDALARFPAENPSPVMRFSMRGQALIYVNRASR